MLHNTSCISLLSFINELPLIYSMYTFNLYTFHTYFIIFIILDSIRINYILATIAGSWLDFIGRSLLSDTKNYYDLRSITLVSYRIILLCIKYILT